MSYEYEYDMSEYNNYIKGFRVTGFRVVRPMSRSDGIYERAPDEDAQFCLSCKKKTCCGNCKDIRAYKKKLMEERNAVAGKNKTTP